MTAREEPNDVIKIYIDVWYPEENPRPVWWSEIVKKEPDEELSSSEDESDRDLSSNEEEAYSDLCSSENESDNDWSSSEDEVNSEKEEEIRVLSTLKPVKEEPRVGGVYGKPYFHKKQK